MEKALPRIQSTYEKWQQLYNQWLELEEEATGRPGNRYPALSAESLAFEIIEENLTSGHLDRYLGPLKFRYRNPNFMNCHTYLLARGLEFLEAPEPPVEAKVEIPPARKLQPPLEDPISALTGRLPQQHSVPLATAIAKKTTQFAFLKSLSAVETFLQLDEGGSLLRADGTRFQGRGALNEMTESTSIAAVPLREGPPSDESELKMPKKTIMSVEDGDDPIAMLENRLGLK
jgi:hypothetical protein